jgi:hypothetical protein
MFATACYRWSCTGFGRGNIRCSPQYGSGFADQQVKEETLKAGLILSHAGWRPVIDRAEGHGYFCGTQWQDEESPCNSKTAFGKPRPSCWTNL